MASDRTDGFILPTVLITGLSIFIIGLSLVQSSISIRSSIDNEYYNKIASEAAEAGTDYAAFCLKQNNYVQPWPTTLTQSTACNGQPLANPVSIMPSGNGVTSSFSVGAVVRGVDGSYIVDATSTVNRVAVGGTTVVKSYSAQSLKSLGQTTGSTGAVTFGYHPVRGDTGNTKAVFYAVKGLNGTFMVAGGNPVGQLGTGDTQNVLTPKPYVIPGKTIVSAFSNFSSQGYNMFFITADGLVYGSGLGAAGQLGNNSFQFDWTTPQQFVLPAGEQATYVAPNGNVTYVLTQSNNIYAAGVCAFGQLGVGAPYSPSDDGTCGGYGNLSQPKRVQLPTPTSDPNTIPTSQIITDANTAFVLMQGGRIYGWGRNGYGEFGISGQTTSANSNAPIQIGTFGNPGQPKAVEIDFDGDSLYVLDSNGVVWAAGRNDYGQLGYAPTSFDHSTTFVQFPIPAGNGTAQQIATDQWTVLVRMSNGTVWGAGLDGEGELGNNNVSGTTTSPVQFILPPGALAAQVYNDGLGTATGVPGNDTLVVTTDGRVFGAGDNSTGQLGDGNVTHFEPLPVQMLVFGPSNPASTAIVGYGTTLITTANHIYYTVGNNEFGQLGDGTTTNSSTPKAAEYLKTYPTYLF